jgi:hypothetical protein
MRRTVLPAAVLAFVLGFVLLGPALEAQEEVGWVVELEGRLTETQLWDGATKPLREWDRVRTQTRLECGASSRAELLVNGEKAFLEMGERTTIEADSPGLLRVITGKLSGFLSGLFGRFRVDTPQGHMITRGTAFAIQVAGSRTLVWTFEGHVEVSAAIGGPQVVLSPGEMTVVRTGRQPTPPTPFDPRSGATGSGATPPHFDRPTEEQPDPPVFLVPEELPPRRGIDPPARGGGE